MARDLARRGRELNKQMKEKHRKAARDIFDYRNPGDQVQCGPLRTVSVKIIAVFTLKVDRLRDGRVEEVEPGLVILVVLCVLLTFTGLLTT